MLTLGKRCRCCNCLNNYIQFLLLATSQIQLSSQCMGGRWDLNWYPLVFFSCCHASVNFSQNIKKMMVVVVFSDGFHQSLRREYKSANEIGIYQSVTTLAQNVSKVSFKYIHEYITNKIRPAPSWLSYAECPQARPCQNFGRVPLFFSRSHKLQ